MWCGCLRRVGSGQVGDVLQMRFNDFGGVGEHESVMDPARILVEFGDPAAWPNGRADLTLGTRAPLPSGRG